MISPTVGKKKKKVGPRNGINMVMIDSSFTDLCLFFFLTCQTSHCHFTLGFNQATKVEMAILLLY